jgi:Trk K+ transport system NAD-binding subunit
MPPSHDDRPAVLVCGLGRLGQHCLASLRAFDVPLRALDLKHPEAWHVADRPLPPDSIVTGDCRSAEQLRRAGAESCRAVVIVTGSERANIAAAIAARAVNQRARIVVRSRQQNLSRLLSQQLGNFVAYEPTLLSAPALALAALGGDTLGRFRLDGELVRVLRREVRHGHGWVDRKLVELNGSRRRVLHRRTAGGGEDGDFGRSSPQGLVGAGDVVTWIEIGDDRDAPSREEHPSPLPAARPTASEPRRDVWRALSTRWAAAPQIARVSVFAAAVIIGLYLACALFYRLQYPDITTRDALNVAMVLILGGYDNLFGQLRLPFPIPAWLHVLSVLVSVSGTVGIGIVYAFLTERVLSVRFQFFLRRPRPPSADHVVLIGLGPLGLEVADHLLREKRPLVAVSEVPPEANVLARVPSVAGPLEDSLRRAHVDAARSVVALGDDDVANLEAALTARALSPNATVVLRADDASFRENVAQLVPRARVLGVHAVAAEAFAAAALGENILQLLHVDDRTLLVTEYHVDDADTLHDRLLGEVAYGFGVIPLLLRRQEGRRADFFPSDDIRLRPGDQVVVLASIDGLRDVESGAAAEPAFRVRVNHLLSQAAAFEGALAIARVSGCDVAVAQSAMAKLPVTLPTALYAAQAARLVTELQRIAVDASVVEPARDLVRDAGA